MLSASCALLKREGKSGEGEEGRRIRRKEGGGQLRERRRKEAGRRPRQAEPRQSAICRVGATVAGPAGCQGGAPLCTMPSPRHQPPPPVGVGGYGWRCPKAFTYGKIGPRCNLIIMYS
jgi:hypothetical protein